MKSGFGKFGLVFLALTLCLAGTGAAFAKWCDSVEVVGVVNTGEVKLGIYDFAVLDQGPDPQCTCTEWNFDNSEGKDVAVHTSENAGKLVCEKEIMTPPNWPYPLHALFTAPFHTKVIETVDNAYPGYMSGSWVYIGNCGTVPVKIEDIDLNVVRDNKGLAPFMKLCGYRIWSYTGAQGQRTFGEIDCPEEGIIDNCLVGLQLDPCEYMIIYFEFCFIEELEDGRVMPQNASLTAEITVEACQWNEFPSAAGG